MNQNIDNTTIKQQAKNASVYMIPVLSSNILPLISLPIILSYLMGSISGSLILGKIKNIDIRTMGSGNAGGTNALRSAGIMFGFLTALIDLTKGIIPAYLASHDISLILMCGGASIVGHVYPIFYNFRGGKGAGTFPRSGE